MKIYCQKCGAATEYSYSKPKFCGNCGNNFANIYSSAQPSKTLVNKITQNKENEEEGVEKVPHLSNLDFDLDIKQNKGIPIKKLAGTQGNAFFEERIRQTINKEDFLESFKKEAGFYPSRQEINEEEN
jgi:hypothetical protein